MSVDDSVDDYDFNNENDVSNFCPDVPAEGDGYDDDVGGAPVEGGGDEGGEFNTSLVAAPNKVEKIQVTILFIFNFGLDFFKIIFPVVLGTNITELWTKKSSLNYRNYII
jgi:hypothetical protein